jgi:hypothetical protein
VDLAYETLLAMPKHGVVPTLRHLNTVLGACVKTRDKYKIVALTELIGRLGKKPDRATYTSFMFLHYRLRARTACLPCILVRPPPKPIVYLTRPNLPFPDQ